MTESGESTSAVFGYEFERDGVGLVLRSVPMTLQRSDWLSRRGHTCRLAKVTVSLAVTRVSVTQQHFLLSGLSSSSVFISGNIPRMAVQSECIRE